MNAALGLFLLVIASVGVSVMTESLLSEPRLAAQIGLTGLAGLCNVAAATERLMTGDWQWYRWVGLGNLSLGCSLPLAFLDNEPVLLAVIGIGGVSLVALGVDMLLFHGEYMHGTSLDHNSN